MKTKLILLLFVCSLNVTHAASLIVNWSMIPSDGRQLTNRTGSPLSAGTASPGDGTLLELGYYSMASVSNPFAGSWLVLSTSTTGDDGVEVAGRFSISSLFDSGALSGLTPSMPLSIRFYDGTSAASSSYFNTVSNTSGAWNFIVANDPAPILNLAIDKDLSIVFQGGVSGAFSSAVPVPEPSTTLLASIGLSIGILYRRRRN